MSQLPTHDIIITPESPRYFDAIECLIANAFATAEDTNGREHLLVRRLRSDHAYLPQLSLMAVRKEIVVGYIMMSLIHIRSHTVLALAPLAVAPDEQGKGIGTLLVLSAHDIARQQGYSWSIVLGDPNFYTRMGYDTASRYQIQAPFDVADPYFMACRLSDTAPRVVGTVTYSAAFEL